MAEVGARHKVRWAGNWRRTGWHAGHRVHRPVVHRHAGHGCFFPGSRRVSFLFLGSGLASDLAFGSIEKKMAPVLPVLLPGST